LAGWPERKMEALGLYFWTVWATVLDVSIYYTSTMGNVSYDCFLYLLMGHGNLQLLDKKIIAWKE